MIPGGSASSAAAERLRLRQQWADAVLRQHLEVAGTCAHCSSAAAPAAWPCLPAKTALLYLGRAQAAEVPTPRDRSRVARS